MNYGYQQTNVELVFCIFNLILLVNPYNSCSALQIDSFLWSVTETYLRRFLFVSLFNISLTSFCMRQ